MDGYRATLSAMGLLTATAFGLLVAFGAGLVTRGQVRTAILGLMAVSGVVFVGVVGWLLRGGTGG